MSTLTKVLIVLQVVFSILLCGVVVSYVATADNYKEDYDAQVKVAQDAKSKMNRTQSDWEDFKDTTVKDLEAAQAQIAALKAEATELSNTIAALELDKLNLSKDIDKYASAANATSQSAQQQTALFERASLELNQLKAEYAQLERQYQEIDDTLIEKLAIIDQQNSQIRSLTEQKADLRGQLQQQYMGNGRMPVATSVTQRPGTVQAQAMTAPALDLKGTVTAVDLGEKLAQISIGTNHGVREKMTFHVTRGSQYVCDIQVIAVDSDRAVGIIGVGQGNPQSGDLITTNL